MRHDAEDSTKAFEVGSKYADTAFQEGMQWWYSRR